MSALAVTGVGVVAPWSPEGWDLRSALGPDTPRAFAEDVDAEGLAHRRWLRKAAEVTRAAACAAALAVADAQWDPPRDETGVGLGTAFGASRYYLEFHEALYARGPQAANAVLFTEGVFNAPTGYLARLHALHGPTAAWVGGAEVGVGAAAWAWEQHALTGLPAALVGGAEQHHPWVEQCLAASGCPPLVEGGAVLTLEAEPLVTARHATPLAWVRGAARAHQGRSEAEDTHRRVLHEACQRAGFAPHTLDRVVVEGPARLGEVPTLAPLGEVGAGHAFGGALGLAVATHTLHTQQFARVGVLGVGFHGGAVAVVLEQP